MDAFLPTPWSVTEAKKGGTGLGRRRSPLGRSSLQLDLRDAVALERISYADNSVQNRKRREAHQVLPMGYDHKSKQRIKTHRRPKSHFHGPWLWVESRR